jgi:hypothetical protein
MYLLRCCGSRRRKVASSLSRCWDLQVFYLLLVRKRNAVFVRVPKDVVEMICKALAGLYALRRFVELQS